MTMIKYIHICSEMIKLWEQTQFDLGTKERMAWRIKSMVINKISIFSFLY